SSLAFGQALLKAGFITTGLALALAIRQALLEAAFFPLAEAFLVALLERVLFTPFPGIQAAEGLETITPVITREFFHGLVDDTFFEKLIVDNALLVEVAYQLHDFAARRFHLADRNQTQGLDFVQNA